MTTYVYETLESKPGEFGSLGGIARRPKGLLVMLSVCRVCNNSRRWYNTALPATPSS